MLHDDFPPPRWREVVMSAQGIVDSREKIGEEKPIFNKGGQTMAKVTAIGGAVVITSAVKAEDIEKVAKYRPEALKLYADGENGKEEVFRVGVGSAGSLNKWGAEFNGVSLDGSGFATITLGHNFSGEDVKEKIADYFGVSILNLNKVEAQIPAALQEIEAEKANIMANIQIG